MAQKYPELIKITDATDWDYYCEDTPEKRDFLSKMGFELILAKDKGYWDILLIDIYKNRKLGIEVLIRKDCQIYRDAFESISPETYYYRLWKSCPAVEVQNMIAFKASVCAYFNALFRLLGYNESPSIINPDEIPF